MAKSTQSAFEQAAKLSPRLKSIALTILALAFIMDLLDSTVVNIAIPTIQHNLHASYSAIQWIVAGYSLAFALLLVIGGRMGDIFGYKKIFLIGIAGFTVASLISGIAPNITWLIIARLLQGAMAALMVPQVTSVMQVMYKPEERGAVNGLFGGLGGAAASLGPIVGGLLIKANIFGLDWRPIFLINVPIGIIAIVAALKYVPDGKSPHPLKLDFLGTFLIIISLFLLTFPLIQGREYNWPAWSIIMIIAFIPAITAFVFWQRYKEKTDGSPLILMSLFKVRSFGVGLFANMIFEATMAGFFLTFTLMLQLGLGYSVIHAALTGLPIAIGIALVMATLGETFIPKLGRNALFIGSLIMGTGVAYEAFMFHHFNIHTTTWELIPGLFMFGAGMGFAFGAMFASVLNGVDSSHAGSASGTLSAVQQAGGAIGVALIGVIFFGQIGHTAAASYSQVSPKLQSQLTSMHIPAQESKQIVASVKECYVDRSKEKDSSITPNSCKQAQNNDLPASISSDITKATSNATAINFSNAFKYSAGFALLLLTAAFLSNFLQPKRFDNVAYSEL